MNEYEGWAKLLFEKFGKVTLDENETLEFTCQLSRPLKPTETIQWYRNAVEIPIEEEYPDEQINVEDIPF